MVDFDFPISFSASSGLDALLDDSSLISRESKRVTRKISSLGDLSDFLRISSETLIHKATQDYWAVHREEDGTLTIERLVDGDAPIQEKP